MQSKHGRICANRSWRLAALLWSCAAAACGDERPPWSGFDLFPADAGPVQLDPELESRLRAAEAAFLATPAAGSGSAGASGSNATTSVPQTAVATSERAGSGADKPMMPAMSHSDSGMSPGAAGRGSMSGWIPWLRPRAAADAGAAMTSSAPDAGSAKGEPMQPDAGSDADGGD